ncbi:AraC family transcriptional regulator [Pedobacter rhodius]|uniref:AraC family transcriptional regulator n=1 Tax=Pedobacter rhodius TaxID=3004098 RepID=A0ABT4KUI4_9SPHI|nr:AraC family transcriptional regulator [Pedobacter sp. SJ11]MCZ4222573.1 AraC family transcriptional regulator [Pedobacter sp. SJ11]
MINYFKYLPVSDEEKIWGLYVLNAGCTRIEPNQAYPYKNHPSHHNFTWENGRILNEFQLIYITKGQGIFESESAGKLEVAAGNIILLFPGERHRYKPNSATGWDEYWIGFQGGIIDNLVSNNFFTKENPITDLGFNERILNTLLEIIERTKEEKSGYQSLISGAVLYLLGHIHSSTRQVDFNGKEELVKMIDKARVILRANIDENISPEEVASELKVSYSYFRKIFKTYVGISPGQYLIQLKIQRAKEHLLNPEKSIKQIAYDLNFESNFYFSKIFKDKTGFTPNQYRDMQNVKMKSAKV